MLLVKPIPYKFILFAALILIADFALENINHKFQLNDFKVYYGAANALASGKQVYGVDFALGSGYYKYSPFTAMLFSLLGILPYYYACVIEFILTSVAIIITSIIILDILSAYVFKQPAKSPNLLLSLSLLCIITHIVRELELGNVNVILLLLLCLSLLFTIRKKYVFAGIFLGLVIITKPFFILFLIPLILRRYFKTVLITVVALFVFLILPTVFLGFTGNIEIHKQWLNTMLAHAGGFASPNTIEALIRNTISASLPSNFQYVVLLVFLVPHLLFIRKNILNSRGNENIKLLTLVMEWFILLAAMPSLFRTDTEHFLMTLPLIIFLLIYLFSTKNIYASIFFVLLIILFVGNISDILGKQLSSNIREWGVLGASNVLLVILACYCYYKQVTKPA